ncbi:hypothetical protein, partial [Methylicorpusculum sp.]|uniref:hypothetical protein n=1 Tax=Methylicorpusculum sp. TaxID=2713644 RepID=UPI002ABCC780
MNIGLVVNDPKATQVFEFEMTDKGIQAVIQNKRAISLRNRTFYSQYSCDYASLVGASWYS